MHTLALLPAIFLSMATSEGATSESNAAEPGADAAGTPSVAASKPVADTPPARAEPKRKGTGMLATTAVLGATSLGVTIARSAVLKKNCPLDSSTGPAQCSYDFGSDIGLAATQWTLNFATIGFASGTGVLMGRYHAWKDQSSGRMRNVKLLRGLGGGLIGAGVVGIGTSVALAFVLPKRCLDKELESGDALAGDRCLLKSYPAWTMTNWASFSMVSSGAAMLAYGTNYKERRGAVAELRFSPYAGPTYAGVGMSGRF